MFQPKINSEAEVNEPFVFNPTIVEAGKKSRQEAKEKLFINQLLLQTVGSLTEQSSVSGSESTPVKSTDSERVQAFQAYVDERMSTFQKRTNNPESDRLQVLLEMVAFFQSLLSEMFKNGVKKAEWDAQIGNGLVDSMERQNAENIKKQQEALQAQEDAKIIRIILGTLGIALAILTQQYHMAVIGITMMALTESGAIEMFTEAMAKEFEKQGDSPETAKLKAAVIIGVITMVVSMAGGMANCMGRGMTLAESAKQVFGSGTQWFANTAQALASSNVLPLIVEAAMKDSEDVKTKEALKIFFMVLQAVLVIVSMVVAGKNANTLPDVKAPSATMASLQGLIFPLMGLQAILSVAEGSTRIHGATITKKLAEGNEAISLLTSAFEILNADIRSSEQGQFSKQRAVAEMINNADLAIADMKAASRVLVR